MQKILKEIEDKVCVLLKSECGAQKPLSELCRDSCSELSRLSAYWVSQRVPNATYTIIQGIDVSGGKKHDLLAITSEEKHYLVDATVWQFFPEYKSIFLGEFEDINKVLFFLTEMYGGTWSITEKFNEESFTEKDEWKKVIRMNASQK